MHVRFNRDIVECKEIFEEHIDARRTGFNRDIVECKVHMCVFEPRFARDLIETLWNVKEEMLQTDGGADDGFNRDIVECKE